jgi:hypothetical protein
MKEEEGGRGGGAFAERTSETTTESHEFSLSSLELTSWERLVHAGRAGERERTR